MKVKRIIGFVLLLMISSTLSAKGKAKEPAHVLTQEEQMRLDYYLYAALDATERNNHAKAYFLLEFCHEIDPTNPTVCSLMGSYQQSLYGKEKALPLLRTAYEGSPDDYWYRYAVTAYELGQHKTTMDVIKQMEKRQPKDIDILELHEQILLHESKYKQTLAIRDKVDKLTGEPTVQSVFARYEIYRSMGDQDRALQVLDAYLERNPNDGRMRAMRTDIDLTAAQKANDVSAGRRLLTDQLHSADVALPNKLKLLKQHSGWLGYDASEQLRWLEDLKEQYPFEQAVYEALMTHAEQQEQYSTAREIGQTLLTMNPTDNQLRERVADLMRNDESVSDEQVGQFIEQSYDILPDDPKWGYFKALQCWQRADYDSTLIVLERAIAHAEEPTVRVLLLTLYGDILGQQKLYDKAFAAYDEVLQLAPEHLSVLNNYAWSLAISGGDLKKAEKMSQRTIQKEANNPTYLDTYAWILHLQGQDTLALFYLKKALEHAKGDDVTTIREHYEAIGK